MKIRKSCLVVTAHSVAESLISDNLSLSFQEGLEALLHHLQLLLVQLKEEKINEKQDNIIFFKKNKQSINGHRRWDFIMTVIATNQQSVEHVFIKMAFTAKMLFCNCNSIVIHMAENGFP